MTETSLTHTTLGTADADDVVATSVAAYTDHIDEYTAYNADAVSTEVNRFLTGLPAGAAILDAGCGPGRDMERFAAAGMHPVGVDLNPHFVLKASKHGFAGVGDLRDLPYADNTFDAVWACASLVHLPENDARQALAEIARVVLPGGRVYVGVKHAGTTGWADTAHGRRWFQIWNPQDFAAAVADTGLVVNCVEEHPVFVDVWATAP